MCVNFQIQSLKKCSCLILRQTLCPALYEIHLSRGKKNCLQSDLPKRALEEVYYQCISKQRDLSCQMIMIFFPESQFITSLISNKIGYIYLSSNSKDRNNMPLA